MLLLDRIFTSNRGCSVLRLAHLQDYWKTSGLTSLELDAEELPGASNGQLNTEVSPNHRQTYHGNRLSLPLPRCCRAIGRQSTDLKIPPILIDTDCPITQIGQWNIANCNYACEVIGSLGLHVHLPPWKCKISCKWCWRAIVWLCVCISCKGYGAFIHGALLALDQYDVKCASTPDTC